MLKDLTRCRCLGGKQLLRLRIVCEPTGGFERHLQKACWELGILISLVNPKRVRRYIEGCGIASKTDAIDARMLWQYGTERLPQPLAAPSEIARQLRALVTRRSQLIKSVCEHQCQLKQHHYPDIIADAKCLIANIKGHIKSIDARLRELAAACPRISAKIKAMRQVKGVGFLTAVTTLTLMPELGQLNRNEAAALLGVAPMNADSGERQGRRYIQGGRHLVHATLYMAALTASRHNAIFKEQYNRLIAKGKQHKVALVAIMNKLIKTLNSILKSSHFVLHPQ